MYSIIYRFNLFFISYTHLFKTNVIMMFVCESMFYSYLFRQMLYLNYHFLIHLINILPSSGFCGCIFIAQRHRHYKLSILLLQTILINFGNAGSFSCFELLFVQRFVEGFKNKLTT